MYNQIHLMISVCDSKMFLVGKKNKIENDYLICIWFMANWDE